MSLLSQVQAKPGRGGGGRTVDKFPQIVLGGRSDDDHDVPRQEVTDPLARLYRDRRSFPNKKIQSRDFKTACFVFCSFRFLIRGTMSSGSQDLSAAAPPSV